MSNKASPRPRVLWTLWPSTREPIIARFVLPWPVIIEHRGPGSLELAGYDGEFYTGLCAICPSRGWTFRTRAAALRAHDRLTAKS